MVFPFVFVVLCKLDKWLSYKWNLKASIRVNFGNKLINVYPIVGYYMVTRAIPSNFSIVGVPLGSSKELNMRRQRYEAKPNFWIGEKYAISFCAIKWSKLAIYYYLKKINGFGRWVESHFGCGLVIVEKSSY